MREALLWTCKSFMLSIKNLLNTYSFCLRYGWEKNPWKLLLLFQGHVSCHLKEYSILFYIWHFIGLSIGFGIKLCVLLTSFSVFSAVQWFSFPYGRLLCTFFFSITIFAISYLSLCLLFLSCHYFFFCVHSFLCLCWFLSHKSNLSCHSSLVSLSFHSL